MKKICHLTGMSEDQTFSSLIETLKDKITQWDYFVNWQKVLGNIQPIEYELNLLNSLIGKSDIEAEATKLILKYPSVISAIPTLLAVRDNSVKVLVDVQNFLYENYDFTERNPSKIQAQNLAHFIICSGLGDLLKNKTIKNWVDYAAGVEVGLDSNGRKNRGGALMETIVETFVAKACSKAGYCYMKQATASKIQSEWNLPVKVDKSSRRIDFAIKRNGQLYFIETNFYGGGGSKLKSTATEYVKMNEFWNNQGIEFVWITDGHGWLSTQRPLREYFDKADYLMNLSMLQQGLLEKMLK